MTTATSSSNQKSLFVNLCISDIKKYSSMSIILFLCFFFTDVMNTINENSYASIAMREPHRTSSNFGAFLLVIGVLLFSTFLFRYLHNRRATDFYHSLPIGRKTLLMTKYVVGVTLCIIPTLISYILQIIVYPTYGFAIPWDKIMIEFFNHIVFILAAWSIASLVAVNTSTSIEMFGYTGALWLMGIALPTIYSYFYNSLIYGYSGNISLLGFLTPCMLLINDWGSFASIALTFLWIILSFVIIWWAILSYQKRKSEYAEQWGRDTILSQVVKAFGGILGAFFFAMMIIDFDLDRPIKFFIGIVLGVPIAYLIIEGITAKGLHTIKRCLPRIAILTASVFILAISAIYTGGFGYETWLPKASSVKSIEFDGLSDYIYSIDNIKADPFSPIYDKTRTVTSPEIIEKIIALQKKKIDNIIDERNHTNDTKFFAPWNFTYNTKFSKHSRVYSMYGDDIKDLMEIFRSPEFIQQDEPLFYIHPAHITSVLISDKLSRKGYDPALDDDKLSRLLEAARADSLELNTQQFMDVSNNKELGTIEFILKTPEEVLKAKIDPPLLVNDCILIIRESYTRTLALLKEWDMEIPNIDPDSVSHISVYLTSPDKYVIGGNNLYTEYSYAKDIFLTTTIDDKALISKIVDAATYYNFGDKPMNSIGVVQEGRRANAFLPATTLFIDNETLLEIMAGRPEKIAYLLTDSEYNACVKTIKSSNNSQLPENIMDVSGTSVGEYFEKNFPEFLEGRSKAVVDAMYKTPFVNEDGYYIMYGYSYSNERKYQ